MQGSTRVRRSKWYSSSILSINKSSLSSRKMAFRSSLVSTLTGTPQLEGATPCQRGSCRPSIILIGMLKKGRLDRQRVKSELWEVQLTSLRCSKSPCSQVMAFKWRRFYCLSSKVTPNMRHGSNWGPLASNFLSWLRQMTSKEGVVPILLDSRGLWNSCSRVDPFLRIRSPSKPSITTISRIWSIPSCQQIQQF